MDAAVARLSAAAAIVLPPREAFAPEASGAISLIVHRLARAGSGFPAAVIGAASAQAPYSDVPFLPVRLPRWSPFGINAAYASGVVRTLRQMRPSLVEVHNQPELALRIARRVGGARTVLVLHNDPHGMRAARTPAQREVLLGRLAGVAAVSAYLRGRFLDGLPPNEAGRVEILPNAIDLASLPRPMPPDRRRADVLFAGRVVADKGADTFVAACARALPALPGWRATMIGADRFGPGSPETHFLRDLRRAAGRAGIAMLGYRPHDEVLRAMAEAAIVAVPSRWAEPFGLTALEAMACGAALICTRQGALPEVAGEAALYVAPDDPAGLAAAIRQLAADPARRAALAAAGRERARRFDLPQAVRALDGWRARILA